MSETTHEQQPVATPKNEDGFTAPTSAGVGALSATLGNQGMSAVFGGGGRGRGQAVGAAGRPTEAGATATAPGDDLIVARMADLASERRALRRSHRPAVLPSTPTLARDEAAPTKPVPDAGSAFEVKIDINSHPTVNLSGRVVFTPQKSSVTVGTPDGGKASALDRKISVAKGLGKPWASSFAARLAKWEPEAGKTEIYPGVTVTTDIQALEAKLEDDKDIDISLLKIGIQIDADIMQLAPPDEWAELNKQHGYSLRVMGRAEWKLSAAQASGLAKVKAATEKSKKLAEEATALAEKNKAAMQKIQASERRAANLLKKGKQELAAAQRMRGGAAKAEAIKKAKAKIAKATAKRAANAKEIAKLESVLANKKVEALAAEKAALEAEKGLGRFAQGLAKVLKSTIAKTILKCLNALGIALTIYEVGAFIVAVAKHGFGWGFDKPEGGSQRGEGDGTGAGGADGGGGGAGARAGGADEEAEFDQEGPAASVDVSEPEDAGKVPLHANAAAVASAMGLDTTGKNPGVSDIDLASLNHLVPSDLSEEELQSVVDAVKSSGAKTPAQAASVILKSAGEARKGRDESKDPAQQQGGGGEKKPDEPATSGVRDLSAMPLQLQNGFDPKKPPAAGSDVALTVSFTYAKAPQTAILNAKYLHDGGQDDRVVFFFENQVQWEKQIDEHTVIVMPAGSSLEFSWTKQFLGRE
jgi:hypothetical protein